MKTESKHILMNFAIEVIGSAMMLYGYGNLVSDNAYRRGYKAGKHMQCTATTEAMEAILGEKRAWMILDGLNDYYKLQGWTK